MDEPRIVDLLEARVELDRTRLADRLNRRIVALAKQIERAEQDAITAFVPLPHTVPFLTSRKQIAIVAGSNQAGKSLVSLVKLCWAVLGRDPLRRFPRTGGRAIIVGYDGDHLADPLYKKLFREGEIKLIRDERTGRWRSVRPDPTNPRRLDPYDLAYREKWRDAPPLIPPRMVADQAWEQASKDIPRVTRLTNGWTILWRSSAGRPPRGRQIHYVHLDEDIRNTAAWVNELIPRLIKEGGYLTWAATAQEGGPELYEWWEKAEKGSPHVDAFRLLIDDNPYISDEQKKFFFDMLTSDEERSVRYFGENSLVGRKIYPHYDPMGVHGCEPFAIPQDWARYAAVDPGGNRMGSLLLAVDPQERHRWVYDGFELRQSTAHQWAYELLRRQGDTLFEAIIIDSRAGKSPEMGGSNLNVAQQYWKALAETGVQPRRTGPLAGFFPSSHHVEARQEALKEWMSIRGAGPFAGTPKLQVMRGVLPSLDRQIALAQTKPNGKRAELVEDLLDCLEYLAAFDPRYYRPEPVATHQTEFAWPTPQPRLRGLFDIEPRRRRRRTIAFGPGMEIG